MEFYRSQIMVCGGTGCTSSNSLQIIDKLEKQIAEKEEQLEELRQKRFDPEYYHDYQKMNELDEQIDDLHNEIEHLMQRWEECLEG